MVSIPSIWVSHPVSGNKFDIAPLLYWLEQFDAQPDAGPGEGALLAVRRMIRAMNVAQHNSDLTSPEQLVDLYVDLHRLEDMFENISSRPVDLTTTVVESTESAAV